MLSRPNSPSVTKLSLAGAAVFTIAYALWLAFRLGGDAGLRSLSEIAFQLPPMAATGACAFAAWRSRGRERLGWAAFAAGMGSWAAAEWIWSGYDLFFRTEPPLFSAADPPYYLGYPFVMAAIALLVRPPRGSHLDAKSLLDALLLMIVLGVIAWKWLLIPIYEHTDASTFDLFITFSYPALDLALLAAIIFSFYREQGALGVPALLLVAGAVMMTVTDSVYLYAATVTGYHVLGDPLELGWVVSYFAFGIAAVAHAEGLSPAAKDAPRQAGRVRRLHALGLALPYAALLPLVALNLYGLLIGAPDAVLWAGMIEATALVAARQFLTLRELAESHDELEDLNVQLQASMGIEHHLARTDALTGIPNRRFVDELVEAEIARANRYGQDLSVAMADVDALKTINDTYGHQAGDEMLRHLAQLARESCRSVDIVGRYGGDEFVFVLPSTSRDQAAAFAERFRKRLGRSPAMTRGGQPLHVRASLGVAQWDATSMKTASELIHKADEVMYVAKASGRNRTMVAVGNSAQAA